MKKYGFGQSKAISVKLGKVLKGKISISLLVVLGLSIVALATPPFGIVLNQIVAMGTALRNISENLRVGSNPSKGGESDISENLQVGSTPNEDSESEDWRLQVRTQGATDFYVQHIVVGPGGYSGWHTHPGLLIGTVVSGSIDFYDANCQRRSFNTGQVFTENTEVHAIINTGSVNADLSIAYLIKHNLPRRIEADAPACAPTTGIP
jgi:quercetin dioxygenase-like cupin family protein